MIELKPCPFCGMKPDPDEPDTCHPSWIRWRDTGEGYYEYLTRNNWTEDSQPCWDFNCVTIAGGCGAMVSGHSEEEVIEKWNRRV